MVHILLRNTKITTNEKLQTEQYWWKKLNIFFQFVLKLPRLSQASYADIARHAAALYTQQAGQQQTAVYREQLQHRESTPGAKVALSHWIQLNNLKSSSQESVSSTEGDSLSFHYSGQEEGHSLVSTTLSSHIQKLSKPQIPLGGPLGIWRPFWERIIDIVFMPMYCIYIWRLNRNYWVSVYKIFLKFTSLIRRPGQPPNHQTPTVPRPILVLIFSHRHLPR